jgi:signal transduction histidine kinase
LNLELENSAASRLTWQSALLLAICCMLLNGCRERQADGGPSIEFTRVPLSTDGGPDKVDVIEGHVHGARPGQQIVLFVRSDAWYVQPLADQPFTEIQPDSSWRSLTHLGTEYAALLVEPEYRPPAKSDALPGEGDGVVAVAIETGEVRLLVPMFWQTWWFRLSAGLTGLVALLTFYRFRLHQVTRQLNLRFEERLAERTQIAQELHDTLLQGVISASMQLHVAVDRLPEDLQAKPSLTHVLQLMGQVLEEGRDALQRLRTSTSIGSLDVEQAFSRIQHEIANEQPIGYRVTVDGRPRPVHPIIRDEIYRIGREALVNAFRHSQARHIEVEVKYKANHLRVIVRDDGSGITPQMLRSGRDGHWGLSGMRERAERIGARLKVRSRAAGTEVELSVPGHVAFQSPPSKSPLRWFARWSTRSPRPGTIETRKRGE